MISTSGSQLLAPDAVSSVCKHLLPMTTILTPNIPEAVMLLRSSGASTKDPQSLDDAIHLAKQLQKLGPTYILLKGGHLPLTAARVKASGNDDASIVVDVLFDGNSVTLIETKFSQSKNTHGTGCSLASAIAANLANRMDTVRAVREACRFVEAGIKTSISLGKGHGPINHFHSTFSLPFAPYVLVPNHGEILQMLISTRGHFLDYILERPDVQPLWDTFTKHEFVARLADSSLPVEKFKHYLVQDYLYLVSARCAFL